MIQNKWSIHGLFSVYFRSVRTSIKSLQQINVKNDPSIIRCLDLNSRPLGLQQYRATYQLNCSLPTYLVPTYLPGTYLPGTYLPDTYLVPTYLPGTNLPTWYQPTYLVTSYLFGAHAVDNADAVVDVREVPDVDAASS